MSGLGLLVSGLGLLLSGLGLLVSGLGLIFAALEVILLLRLFANEMVGKGHGAPLSSFRTSLDRVPGWSLGMLCPKYMPVTRAVRDRHLRRASTFRWASQCRTILVRH